MDPSSRPRCQGPGKGGLGSSLFSMLSGQEEWEPLKITIYHPSASMFRTISAQVHHRVGGLALTITVSLVEGAQYQEAWRSCGRRQLSLPWPDASSIQGTCHTPSLPPGTVPTCPPWLQSAQKPATLGKWASHCSQ